MHKFPLQTQLPAVPAQMLSRSDFEPACKALVRRLADWQWVDKYPYGYLTRCKHYRHKTARIADAEPEDEELEEDEATARPTSGLEDVISQQYVVYSPGFQVPAFYFTVHNTSLWFHSIVSDQPIQLHQDGTPLTLDELMDTTLFKFEVPAGSSANGYALSLPDAPFPLLSQGDHPTLGTPCWYLHPCETQHAVDELFREVDEIDQTVARWMELWMMTVSSVVDL